MAIEAAELVGGALGGAVASATLGPLIAQRRERLNVRAAVLERVADVERARWAPREFDAFRQAVIGLRTAALVAGANRDVVEQYVFLAMVARRASDDSWEMSGGDEEAGGGAIWSSLSELVQSAAAVLVDHLWHPFRKRYATRRGLARVRDRESELRADEHDERLNWDPVPF